MSFIAELRRRNVIRVCTAYIVAAWLIIQVVETVFPAFGFGDAALRLVTIVLATGLVPTAVFAWAFEWTPDGLKKDSEVDRSQSIAPQTGKKLDRVIMVTLAVALGYFAVDKFVFTPQRQAEDLESARQQAREDVRNEQKAELENRSIAVLPFTNVSGDEDDEIYTDGITDDLLILLGKVPEIRTPSRNSVFRFKNSETEIGSIASQLSVRFILEGTVRRLGDSIRVTAQLVNAQTDTSMWSDAFDRDLGDIFSVQDDIVASVVRRLDLNVDTVPPTASKTDPEVYALFLQARHLNRRSTPENVEEAHRLLTQALALDAGYAPVYQELAATYLNKVRRGLMSPEEGLHKLREMANKAIELDPGYALAHAKLALAALQQQPDDVPLAARHLKRALELQPTNREVLGNALHLLMRLHRSDEYIRVAEYLVATDPMDHVPRFNLSVELFAQLRYGEVLEHMRVVDRLAPGIPYGNYMLGMSLLFTGDAVAGHESLKEEELERERVSGLATINCALGWEDQAEPLLQQIRETQWWQNAINNGASSGPFLAGAALASCGEIDLAYEALRYHIDNGGYVDDERFPSDPRFENLRDDPRWPALLQAYATNHPQHPDVPFQIPSLQ